MLPTVLMELEQWMWSAFGNHCGRDGYFGAGSVVGNHSFGIGMTGFGQEGYVILKRQRGFGSSSSKTSKTKSHRRFRKACAVQW